MYKLLLCWRYLRTRYIALVSVISVTLGVATMIVVNSVMEGFTHEMQDRIHGILSDLVVETRTVEGFHDPQWHMDRIRGVVGDDVAGMTPTVVVPAMLTFSVDGHSMTRHVSLIGVDERTHSAVSDFGRFLQHPENRRQLSFALREEGYDTHDHQAGAEAPPRPAMEWAGWKHRRTKAHYQKERARLDEEMRQQAEARMREIERDQRALRGESNQPQDDVSEPETKHPFAKARGDEGAIFDPAQDTWPGIVLGIALASYRGHDGADRFFVLPGDDVTILLGTASLPPKIMTTNFTISDLYESKMSEYDANFVFVPIEKLQSELGMIDPSTGIGNVSAIQIKLRPGVDGNFVRDKLRAEFPAELYVIATWRDKQGPLLAAVQMETAILNVLLFMIIAVAGFGILAIFYMIVVEKTRDIGILKSLGAPSRGVMGIFLTYGLSLGIVGSGAGMAIGLVFVAYINNIADALAWLTGQEVFDPAIYYFQKIPTIVVPFTVAWIVAGAMLIAVVASIMPARRAARLHPVEALRYE